MPRFLITWSVNYLLELEAADAQAARAQAESIEPAAWDFSDATPLDVFELTDSVVCSVCHKLVPADTAHPHQNHWIGDECWDEHLRASE